MRTEWISVTEERARRHSLYGIGGWLLFFLLTLFFQFLWCIGQLKRLSIELGAPMVDAITFAGGSGFLLRDQLVVSALSLLILPPWHLCVGGAFDLFQSQCLSLSGRWLHCSRSFGRPRQLQDRCCPRLLLPVCFVLCGFHTFNSRGGSELRLRVKLLRPTHPFRRTRSHPYRRRPIRLDGANSSAMSPSFSE